MVSTDNLSVFSVPSYSYSGKYLTCLHQTAFCTDSVFKKYFTIPLAAGCVLPFLGIADSGRWLFATLLGGPGGFGPMNFVFFIQTVAHVLLVVALPFRILAYFFGYSKALFSVDYTYRNCVREESAMQSLLNLGINPKFAKEALALPFWEALSPTDRIFYEIAWTYEKPEMAKVSWRKREDSLRSDWFREPLALAVQMENPVFQGMVVSKVDNLEALFDYCFEERDKRSPKDQTVYLKIAISLVNNEKTKRKLSFTSERAEILLKGVLERDIPDLLEKTFDSIIEIKTICQKQLLTLLGRLLSGKPSYKNIVEKALRDLSNSVRMEKANTTIARESPFLFSFFQRENSDQKKELLQSVFYDLLMSSKCLFYIDLVVICLMCKALDVNKPLSNGHTPLTKCTLFQNADLVSLLLKYGAKKDAISNHPDFKGLNAFRIAQKINNSPLIELLKEKDFYSDFARNFSERKFSGFFKEKIPDGKQSASPPKGWMSNSDPASSINDSLFKTSARVDSPLSPILEKLKLAKKTKNLWVVFEPISQRNSKELEKAFKKLSLLIHPDKNLAEQNLAKEIFQTITCIKEYLTSTL